MIADKMPLQREVRYSGAVNRGRFKWFAREQIIYVGYTNHQPQAERIIKAGYPIKVRITLRVITNQELLINQITIATVIRDHVLQQVELYGQLSRVQTPVIQGLPTAHQEARRV